VWKQLKTNIAKITSKILYECLTRFGYPLTIVINQGVHFINDAIKYLTDHFQLKHLSSTTYYPQGNGQIESTNKLLGTLLTKLVSENITYWGEQMFTMLFSYKITYKVATGLYTISITVWITSINAHKVHSASWWWK
jgi:transposase InsO family protein